MIMMFRVYVHMSKPKKLDYEQNAYNVSHKQKLVHITHFVEWIPQYPTSKSYIERKSEQVSIDLERH